MPLFVLLLSYIIGVVATIITKQAISLNLEEFSLHDAVKQQNLEQVIWLLERGFSVDKKDIEGKTALHYAVQEGRIIPELSLNPRNRENLRRRAISHRTVDQPKSVEIIRLLLAHGASVDVRDDHGFTALHGSVQSGNLKIVKTLLDEGAKVDIRNTIVDYTPLEWLSKNIKKCSESKAMMQLLITRGADTFKNNTDLLNHLPDLIQEEMKAFREGCYNRAKKLLKTEYDVNSLQTAADRNLFFCLELQTISRFYALKHMLIRLDSKLWEFTHQRYISYTEKECAFFNAQTALRLLNMDNIRHLSYSGDPYQTLEKWFRVQWLGNDRIPGLELTPVQMIEILSNGRLPPELLEEIRWFRWQASLKGMMVNFEPIDKHRIERLAAQCMSTRGFKLLNELLSTNVSNHVTETAQNTPRTAR